MLFVLLVVTLVGVYAFVRCCMFSVDLLFVFLTALFTGVDPNEDEDGEENA